MPLLSSFWEEKVNEGPSPLLLPCWGPGVTQRRALVIGDASRKRRSVGCALCHACEKSADPLPAYPGGLNPAAFWHAPHRTPESPSSAEAKENFVLHAASPYGTLSRSCQKHGARWCPPP